MNNISTKKQTAKRGRPTKSGREHADTKALLIRSGLVHLTQSGFASTGIDTILKDVGVPKGSFYYYFKNKEAFGLAVIDSYHQFFIKKLDQSLLDETVPPLQRIENFVESAYWGMEKYQFSRGCLVGNLGQEISALPDSFRKILQDVFNDWQQRIAQCLLRAQDNGDVCKTADTDLLAEYFWIGWEGAVLRAKLMQSGKPLHLYAQLFLTSLPK